MQSLISANEADNIICTTEQINDYQFIRAMIIDRFPFDFEYEHNELFGFIED